MKPRPNPLARIPNHPNFREKHSDRNEIATQPDTDPGRRHPLAGRGRNPCRPIPARPARPVALRRHHHPILPARLPILGLSAAALADGSRRPRLRQRPHRNVQRPPHRRRQSRGHRADPRHRQRRRRRNPGPRNPRHQRRRSNRRPRRPRRSQLAYIPRLPRRPRHTDRPRRPINDDPRTGHSSHRHLPGRRLLEPLHIPRLPNRRTSRRRIPKRPSPSRLLLRHLHIVRRPCHGYDYMAAP